MKAAMNKHHKRRVLIGIQPFGLHIAVVAQKMMGHFIYASIQWNYIFQTHVYDITVLISSRKTANMKGSWI